MLLLVQRSANINHIQYVGMFISYFLPSCVDHRNINHIYGGARSVRIYLFSIIRYFTEGTNNFIISWDNRINMFILIVLFVSIISDLAIPELTHHDGGIIASIFLFIRYGLQITRLCKLLL
jgi:hypothetical protein